jgi:arginase
VEETANEDWALLVFRGRAGDRNELAMRGSVLLGEELSSRLGLDPVRVGESEPVLNSGWEAELTAALPALADMADMYERVFGAGLVPVAALTRCAVALATLPIVARHRPDACVVWFDAHADCNIPQTSPTGYLGGLVLTGACGLWDSGLGGGLTTGNIVLGGVRDTDPAEQRLIDEGIVCALPAGDGVAERLDEAIAGRAVYFHLDCDVLEPGIVPTEYRVPGGLSLGDLHSVCGVVAEHEVIGVEIAEFQSAWAPDGNEASPVELLDAMQPLLAR